MLYGMTVPFRQQRKQFSPSGRFTETVSYAPNNSRGHNQSKVGTDGPDQRKTHGRLFDCGERISN